jgi:predicted helicase
LANENWQKSISPILYRPFDVRFIFYDDALIERSRREVMRHMVFGDNIGLVLPRRVEMHGDYRHCFCTSHLLEHVALSLKTIDYLFPLYLFPSEKDEQKQGELEHAVEITDKGKVPNLDRGLLETLKSKHCHYPAPEEVFSYVYGILSSPIYREKYADLLKGDFPRVPFTGEHKLFVRMGKLGQQLVDLHLLKSPELDRPIARFQGKGSSRVEKPLYDGKEERVYINKTQYFEGIRKEVWEYQIGGYQVLPKWLKDRKERSLDLEDVKHYCRIVTALKETIDVQREIDAVYPQVEESAIAFSKAE